MTRWKRAAIAYLLLMIGCGCLFRSDALAHASLLATIPDDGADLPTSPPAIVITFAEPVVANHSRIVVIDSAGNVVADAEPTATDDAHSLHLALPELLPGHYTAEWEAQSVDTHMSAGLIRFTVGLAPAAADTPVASIWWTAAGLAALSLVMMALLRKR